MKFEEYLNEDKIEKAKEILKLLDRDTKMEAKTTSEKKQQRRSRIEHRGALTMLDLSKKEIDELTKWQKKMGYSK